jgi:hypothetical protein
VPVAIEKANAAKAANKSRISKTAEGRGGSGSGASLDVPANAVEGCVDGGGGNGRQAGAPRRGKRKGQPAQEQAPAVQFSEEEVAEVGPRRLAASAGPRLTLRHLLTLLTKSPVQSAGSKAQKVISCINIAFQPPRFCRAGARAAARLV